MNQITINLGTTEKPWELDVTYNGGPKEFEIMEVITMAGEDVNFISGIHYKIFDVIEETLLQELEDGL